MKITYFVPVEVTLTKAQVSAIVKDNMETWELAESAAKDCNDEDYLLAAARLGFLELPSGARFEEV